PTASSDIKSVPLASALEATIFSRFPYTSLFRSILKLPRSPSLFTCQVHGTGCQVTHHWVSGPTGCVFTSQNPRVVWHCISESSRSEEHTSELQSPDQLVCRLLLRKKQPLQRLSP